MFTQLNLERRPVRTSVLKLVLEHSKVAAKQLQRLVCDGALVGILAGRISFLVQHLARLHRALDVLDQPISYPGLSYDRFVCSAVGIGRFCSQTSINGRLNMTFSDQARSDSWRRFLAVPGTNCSLRCILIDEVLIYKPLLFR